MTESTEGVISRRDLLDLSPLRTPDDLAHITAVDRVATVIVPESLAAAYARIPTSRVATTLYVPDGANVRVHTGMLVVGGDGVGSADDVLIVIGLLIITSPITGPVPRQVRVVGSVLAPRGSEPALGPALAGGVGSVTYYRYVEDQHVKVYSGQVRVSGTAFGHSNGGPSDVLVLAGQVVVSGTIDEVRYGQVLTAGQCVLPEAAQELLEPVLEGQGQVVWYRGARPWVVTEPTELTAEFFRLLDEPVGLVVLAELTVTTGVTADLVREKVASVALLANVVAPAEAVPALQALTTDSFGVIRAADGRAG